MLALTDGDGFQEMQLVGVRVEMPSNSPIALLKEAHGDAGPADLDRRCRGDGDRVRPAGYGPSVRLRTIFSVTSWRQ